MLVCTCRAASFGLLCHHVATVAKALNDVRPTVTLPVRVRSRTTSTWYTVSDSETKPAGRDSEAGAEKEPIPERFRRVIDRADEVFPIPPSKSQRKPVP